MSRAEIERLPTELRLSVMSLLEIEDLFSLRAASSAFYQTYMANRKRAILASLSLALGPAMVDARYTYACRRADFLSQRSEDGNRLFVAEYSQSLADRAAGIISYEDITDEAAVEMANFHRKTMEPLLSRMVGTFQRVHPYEPPHCPKTLEAGEKVRLFRAMYRWEMFCNLYSGGRLGLREVECPRGNWSEPSFSRHFRKWETEEIRTIYTMVRVLWTPLHDHGCRALSGVDLNGPSWSAAADRLGVSLSVAASAKESCFSSQSSHRHMTGAGYFPFCNRLLGRGLALLQQALEIRDDPKQLNAKLLEADMDCRRDLNLQHWHNAQTYLIGSDLPRLQTPCITLDELDEEAKRHPRAWCVIYKCSEPDRFAESSRRIIVRFRRMGIVFWGPKRLKEYSYDVALGHRIG